MVSFPDSFSFSPTSQELQFFSVTSSFTRLIMKNKYVVRGLIMSYFITIEQYEENVDVRNFAGGGGIKRKRALFHFLFRVVQNLQEFPHLKKE